jgi:hypothetical protein
MSKMSDGGKGSSPRPFSISQEEYENRWDHIFSRDLKDEKIDMPGTIGGAKVTFKDDNESSSSNSDNREQSTK